MDFNKTLEVARHHVGAAAKYRKLKDSEAAESCLARAADEFIKLDEWLSNGGAPPMDWTKHLREGPVEILQKMLAQYRGAASLHAAAGNNSESAGNTIKANAIYQALEAIGKEARGES